MGQKNGEGKTMEFITLALFVIAIGLVLNGMIWLARTWFSDIVETCEYLERLIERVERLARRIDEIEAVSKPEPSEPPPEPDPEPQPQPQPPDLPTVADFAQAKVWYILEHIATNNEGRLSRRGVKRAGFTRGDYETLRDELQRQGYLKQYTAERQPVDWTDKGNDLLESIQESDWKPQTAKWQVVV
jgi:predicted transcriptional regulator